MATKRRPQKPSMRVKDGRQQPFTWFPNELIRDHGAAIGPHAGWVYMALLTHADKEGVCWPAHETLATMTGMSVAQVKRSLTKLRDLGFITVTMRRPKTSVYTVLDVPERQGNSSEGTSSEGANAIAQVELFNSSDRAINSSGGAIQSLSVSYEVDVLEVDPPNQNHSTTSSPTPPQPTPSAPVSPKAEVAADDFLEVWRAYPKHHDIDDARVAYNALTPDPELRRTILDDIAAKCQNRGGRFLPKRLADYLHNQKWLDAKPEAAQGPPAWLEEDEPAKIPTCDVRNCSHLAGRYSSKRCDPHVEEDLRAEAGQLLEILRGVVPTAYETDYAAATALEEQLGQRAKQYHTPETAWDIAWQLGSHYSPEKLPTYEDILATIGRIQEAAETQRRERAANLRKLAL